jgi:N-acylneuraminate cytidylyltransferase
MPHPRAQDEKPAGASVHNAIRLQGPIAALILDFDGVFTDNKVIVTDDGREAVVCDRSDGHAIGQLKRTGLPILVLSTEKVPIVRFRCDKLGLECIHGVDDKAAALRQWLSGHNIDAQQTVYVGNDVNDIGCMQIVGYPVAVADAYPEAIAAARYVLAAGGGHGAVREIALALAQHLRKTGANLQ